MGYGDYQVWNVTISRVYYMEGLGHNLFSVVQICDTDLKVAFRKHTCFVRNLKGVDLLSGSGGTNIYSLSIGRMMGSSPICLLSKATKTKSWLWHLPLSQLNFGASNHLAINSLVHGLPRLKFEKDHLCSACAMGKSKKHIRVASVNRKKYILVIVDDYSRFTWAKFLTSKDEAPDFIISLEDALHEMTPATPTSGLVPNPPSLASFVPPSRHEWDLVFQTVFDEFFSPPASVASPVPVEEALASIESTGAPSSTTIDQDAPSPSTCRGRIQKKTRRIEA
uniref:Retrovirus-related Pol polyprotein from transposon TNT 1-94 n=1 Tax=Tanacetum cinerariifolium TaxID=118510 RepID=A0A6L2JL10_TANCI|nr:retrovirus-related Pol polyprotein from transposon TNT 1-94 [Tanacetum cinerariifolium]